MTRLIRTIELDEIRTLLDWAAAEGWNPGLGDALPFQAAEPSGFIGAFVDGVMVAAISAVAYDEHFGFIGLYICHKDWRGQGHGKAVWDAGMAHLGSRTIGLDGVPEQQANYGRMGFVRAYETVRMSGTLAGQPSVAVPAGLDQVASYDRACFPAERRDFLEAWLLSPNQCLAASTSDDLRGYAVLRPCVEGYKVGPLFADDVAIALDLLAAMAGPVQIDVPAQQLAFIDALQSRGFVPGFTTARMYRSKAPELKQHRVFGITSLELG
jgi:hypothetical protein